MLTKRFEISTRILKLGFAGFVSLFIVGIVILGVVSWNTSISLWDGAYPSGEYRLYVQTESGMPIKGAILSVFESRSRTPAFTYPIDNHLSEGDLVSNDRGLIVVLHKSQGFEFGGVCHDLFWIYPICSTDSERYDCELSADGYQTIRFTINDLFEIAYKSASIGSAKIILENGQEDEISIYETVYILSK